ncbi:MAG: hypothetical protein ACRELB_22525 [Polyangiaceae bacterium]
MRPEELEALTWDDVEFTARTATVSKAIDGRTHKPKELPKTACAVRDMRIEPALMPELKAMHARRASDDAPIVPVLRTLSDRYRADNLRKHLKLAKVTRPRLTADTATLQPINIRSCRDTGITCLATNTPTHRALTLQAMQRADATAHGLTGRADRSARHSTLTSPTAPLARARRPRTPRRAPSHGRARCRAAPSDGIDEPYGRDVLASVR